MAAPTARGPWRTQPTVTWAAPNSDLPSPLLYLAPGQPGSELLLESFRFLLDEVEGCLLHLCGDCMWDDLPRVEVSLSRLVSRRIDLVVLHNARQRRRQRRGLAGRRRRGECARDGAVWGWLALRSKLADGGCKELTPR